MYKVIEFKSDKFIDKIDCIRQLAILLNTFDDVAISDIDKEWRQIGGYYILTAIVMCYDFTQEA